MKKKTGYTQEFKETAVKLAVTGDKSIAAVAQELGVPDWKLYAWVNAWKKKGGTGEHRAAKDTEAKLRESERRVKELELENDILKKAAA